MATWTVNQLPTFAAVPLSRYVHLAGIDECAFWGVYTPGVERSDCRGIWIQQERDLIQHALLEAQEEVENVLHYPLCLRWITDERLPYTCPAVTAWGHIVGGGIRAVSSISEAEAVDHTTDPAVVGPIATTVTDPAEVHVYFTPADATEAIEVTPSRVVLGGGNLTIYIPRCRLVLPSLQGNDRTGIDYNVLDNFADEVDVLRVYNDTSTQAVLHYPGGCACGCGSCTETTHDALLYVVHSATGQVRVQPAHYLSGSWSAATNCGCCSPQWMTLNYLAGAPPTRQAEVTVIRLAHSKMVYEPCGCDDVRRLWARDRNTPDVLTRERLNCPFGLSDGAWAAWRFAQTMKLVRSIGL